jgi:hypothetical protein
LSGGALFSFVPFCCPYLPWTLTIPLGFLFLIVIFLSFSDLKIRFLSCSLGYPSQNSRTSHFRSPLHRSQQLLLLFGNLFWDFNLEIMDKKPLNTLSSQH